MFSSRLEPAHWQAGSQSPSLVGAVSVGIAPQLLITQQAPPLRTPALPVCNGSAQPARTTAASSPPAPLAAEAQTQVATHAPADTVAPRIPPGATCQPCSIAAVTRKSPARNTPPPERPASVGPVRPQLAGQARSPSLSSTDGQRGPAAAPSLPPRTADSGIDERGSRQCLARRQATWDLALAALASHDPQERWLRREGSWRHRSHRNIPGGPLMPKVTAPPNS